MRIAYAEVAAAVARLWREGAIEGHARDAMLRRLEGDLEHIRVVEIRQGLLTRIPGLVVRRPLRG